MENKVSVGLLGLGVVGSGVVQIINEHQEKLKHQLGVTVEVKRILVRNLEKAREVDVDPSLLTVNPDDVLSDSEIDVDRKSTRLNSSHVATSYAGFCLTKKKHCSSYSLN